MNQIKIVLLIASLLLLNSCTVEPRPINYGEDHCFNCDMTVVSKTHAAEIVTKKGKSYMFDAAECLVWKLAKDANEQEMAFILVSDYAKPGNLVDALTATYLISEKLKSPMGANLTAFKTSDSAKKAQSMHGGKLYTWEELKVKIKR